MLAIGGALILFGSHSVWAVCSTTGCDGYLMAISYMGGMEAGFGVVASIASVILIAIATEESRGPGDGRFIAAAQIVSLVAIATAIVFVVWFYLIGDENMHVLAPPGLGVMLTAFGGAIALAAATSLARKAPTISRS